MQDVDSGPKDDLAQRPECGWVRNIISLIRGKQARDDLRGKTIQPEVHEAESKGDASGKAPVRGSQLALNFFGLVPNASSGDLRPPYLRATKWIAIIAMPHEGSPSHPAISGNTLCYRQGEAPARYAVNRLVGLVVGNPEAIYLNE
jgi:hypothetical protein